MKHLIFLLHSQSRDVCMSSIFHQDHILLLPLYAKEMISGDPNFKHVSQRAQQAITRLTAQLGLGLFRHRTNTAEWRPSRSHHGPPSGPRGARPGRK